MQKTQKKLLRIFQSATRSQPPNAADLIRYSERAISSVGRAPRLHRGCREFESLIAHHSPPYIVFTVFSFAGFSSLLVAFLRTITVATIYFTLMTIFLKKPLAL
jgi:hypothetical protein